MAVVILLVGVNRAIELSNATPDASITVAAIGWVDSRADGLKDPEVFEELYGRPLAQAARQGATLVVSPETAFSTYDDSDPNALDRFVTLSRRHNVYLAVGYFDVTTNENRAAFISPVEGVMGRYVKTHLTRSAAVEYGGTFATQFGARVEPVTDSTGTMLTAVLKVPQTT